eukprot:10967002-Lingulodinium_polyedra.AAC.1
MQAATRIPLAERQNHAHRTWAPTKTKETVTLHAQRCNCLHFVWQSMWHSAKLGLQRPKTNQWNRNTKCRTSKNNDNLGPPNL